MEKATSHFQFRYIGQAVCLRLQITLSLLMSIEAWVGGDGRGGGWGQDTGKKVKYSIYVIVQLLVIITDSQLS